MRTNIGQSFTKGSVIDIIPNAEPEKAPRSWKAWSTLIGGFIYMLYQGAVYITGNLATYVESYFQVKDDSAALLLPTFYVFNSFCMISFARFTAKNVQPKLLIMIATALNLSFLIVAINMSNFWLFYVFYCLSWSLNMGWAYLVTTHHTWLWFPEKPATASGFCIAGYGFGALIFDNILTPLLNPNNDSLTQPCAYTDVENPDWNCYPDSVNQNFKKTMYVLMVCFGICAIIGVITVWQGPLPNAVNNALIDITQDEDDDAQKVGINQVKAPAPSVPTEKEIRQMIMTRQFSVDYIMNVFSIMFGLFVAASYKSYWIAQPDAPSDNFCSLIGSIGALFNGFRFIWSTLLDKFSYKLVYGTLLVMQIVISLTMPLVVKFKWIYALCVCLAYFCLGGHFVMAPNELRKVFGGKTTKLYSYFHSYSGLAGLVECMATLFYKGASLTFFFYLYGGFSAVSFILLICFYSGKKYEEPIDDLITEVLETDFDEQNQIE